MIIHLTGNTNHLEEDLPYLRTIAQTIHENGDVLALNWFENKTVNSRKLAEATSKADLHIIEGSHYEFDAGLDVALATQAKKPVLLVSRTPLEGKSITGITSQYLTTKTYRTAAELATIVNQFLGDNALDSQDQRFNFFIDRQIYNYLRDKAYKTGKSKSEIIRELLDREISGEGR